MIKLLIVGVGRNLHHTYNTIHPAILIFLCLCDGVHHYRATFTPVSRGDLHLGAGCSAVQVYCVLYRAQVYTRRCTQWSGLNTIQLCHGLSWLLHLLSSVSSETYIRWSPASSREKILSVA